MKKKWTTGDSSWVGTVDQPEQPFRRHRSLARWGALAASALVAFALAACSGSDGKDGAPGAPGQDADQTVLDDLKQQVEAITKAANPETCVTCHTGATPVARSGQMHQDLYAELYQDGVVKVSDMAFNVAGTTATLTFKMTKSGAPFDCRKSGSDFAIGSYWSAYDPATKQFTDPSSPFTGTSLTSGGTKAWDAATNVCTFTKTVAAAEAAAMAGNGIVQIYGADGIVDRTNYNTTGRRWSYAQYPFAGVLKVGTVDYGSQANVSGCENCHTRPFLKHGYIYGQVDDGTGARGQDFQVCKGCHLDNRDGGHQDWQLLKDNPARFAELAALADAAKAAGDTTKDSVVENMTQAEKDKYAYKTKLMNDVHMSHAMEFAYPQSMKNCVTCHAGKLDAVLADSKFVVETCKSCHAVDNLREKMTAAAGFNHASVDLNTANCVGCHGAGVGPTFKTIHDGGYDPLIYSSTGARYSDTFVAKIDSASFADNKLTVSFSATGTLGSLSASSITPTLMIGLYGYDTKDFIVAAHGRDAARNRLLEFVVDGVQTNPRFTIDNVGSGTWQVTADLSMWADMIGAGKAIRRAEIAVMPQLKDAAGRTVGLNAPSRTFDLVAKVFDDGFYSDIVTVKKTKIGTVGGNDVFNGCNTCHDQLATTFHSGIRGGNIKVCRICHVVSSGGSHLELQSRSIDSYVHAVHSFQGFDPGDVSIADPVESLEYTHHTASFFPRFGILNCESCHVKGMFNVPDQSRSMPGILSGSDNCANDVPECLAENRKIGDIPAYVTGPAVRACGACHRAQRLNADDAAGLGVLNQHFKTFGYLIEDGPGVWESVVAKIMSVFNYRN